MNDGERQTLKHVLIFATGAATTNPGPGGYGVVLRFGEHRKECSGGLQRTTENRMELLSAAIGLEALKESCAVTLHSDSSDLVKAITLGAASKWRDAGWTSMSSNRPIKNADLWQRLLSACDRHKVEFVLSAGGAASADDARCLALALAACQRGDLPADDGYREPEPAPALYRTTAKAKIIAEGQACGKCGTPVVKRLPRRRRAKGGQLYRFAWYLWCPKCRTIYFVEEAKEAIEPRAADRPPPEAKQEQSGWLFET